MKSLISAVLVFFIAGISLTSGQIIPDKKSVSFKTDPGIENVMLARQLMTYGYTHNDALSLLLAAKIFSEWTPVPLVPESSKTKSGEKVSQVQDPFNVKQLLADAEKFSGGDASIMKMADEISGTSSKGAKKGPVAGTYELRGQDFIAFELKFTGKEVAIVGAVGDGNADIDLVIYDKDMNLIVSDESDSYQCAVMWYPEKTATYYVVVVNRGTNSTKFAIATN